MMGDLAVSRGGSARWSSLADQSVVLGLPLIPSGAISIRVGQLWLSRRVSHGLSPGEIAEVLGWVEEKNCIRIWCLEKGVVNPKKGTLLYLKELPSFGAGSPTLIEYGDIFDAACSLRIFAGQSRRTGDSTRRTVIEVCEQLTPVARGNVRMRTSWTDDVVLLASELNLTCYTLFTDGSFKTVGEPSQMLFEQGSRKLASGGFCMIPNGIVRDILAVHIRCDLAMGVESAFPMELLSIVAALRLAGELPGMDKIVTDSESSLALFKRPKLLRYWSRKANLMLLTAGLKLAEGKKLCHVRSHVERRKPSCDWTRDELGNWIADKVAGNNRDGLHMYNVRWVELDASVLQEDISQLCPWSLVDNAGIPTLASLEECIGATYFNNYITRRDKYHAERLGLPTDPPAKHWSDLTTRFAATAWEMVGSHIVRASSAQRAMWDKLWFSWNEVKSNPLCAVTCPVCGAPDSLAHLVRLCPDPVCAGIRMEGLAEIDHLHSLLSPASKWFGAAILDIACNHPDGAMIFTAMWSPGLLEALDTRISRSGQDCCDGVLAEWRRTLVETSRDLVLITRSLIYHRLHPLSPAASSAAERIMVAGKKRRKKRIERGLKNATASKRKLNKLNSLEIKNDLHISLHNMSPQISDSLLSHALTV